VNVARNAIVLSGKAPRRSANCQVAGYEDNVLEFTFDGCDGCSCDPMATAELRAIFNEPGDPMSGEQTASGEGTSCPYLYAWSGQDSRWNSYGKVIRDARGQRREMTQIIELSKFATKFLLSEQDPEHSFIDQAQLRVYLNDGSHIVLKPTTRELTERDNDRIYIPAFRSVEFAFELPSEIKLDDVVRASLAITGYYESLPPPRPVSKASNISRALKICRAPNVCRATNVSSDN
jgi:hypothetical protein